MRMDRQPASMQHRHLVMSTLWIRATLDQIRKQRLRLQTLRQAASRGTGGAFLDALYGLLRVQWQHRRTIQRSLRIRDRL
jgi:hypothetical protein